MINETSVDKRNYGYAFAAFKGSGYLALVMACKGILSPLDAKEFKSQMLDGIEIVPSDQLSPAGHTVIVEMLETVERMAASNFVAGA